jgi:hypothetical protein
MNAERVLVLRLWLEPQVDGVGAWRASVLNPMSGQRRYFTDPEYLTRFLLEIDPTWPIDPEDYDTPDTPEHAQRRTQK